MMWADVEIKKGMEADPGHTVCVCTLYSTLHIHINPLTHTTQGAKLLTHTHILNILNLSLCFLQVLSNGDPTGSNKALQENACTLIINAK